MVFEYYTTDYVPDHEAKYSNERASSETPYSYHSIQTLEDLQQQEKARHPALRGSSFIKDHYITKSPSFSSTHSKLVQPVDNYPHWIPSSSTVTSTKTEDHRRSVSLFPAASTSKQQHLIIGGPSPIFDRYYGQSSALHRSLVLNNAKVPVALTSNFCTNSSVPSNHQQTANGVTKSTSASLMQTIPSDYSTPASSLKSQSSHVVVPDLRTLTDSLYLQTYSGNSRKKDLPSSATPISKQRERIQKTLDNNEVYTPVSNEFFVGMHQSLRDLNDKVHQHKRMLDRYAGIDMSPAQSVSVVVDEKYQQLLDRMPELNGYKSRDSSYSRNDKSYSDYGTNGVDSGSNTSGLRNRVSRFVCKAKANHVNKH